MNQLSQVSTWDRLSTSYTLATLIVLLALGAFSSGVSAQDHQIRPIARLLSNPESDVTESRPRRAMAEGRDAPEPGGPTSPSFEEATPIERNAFVLTNQARLEKKIEALVWDAELSRMARAHSESMARQGYFAHETPEGLALKHRARSLGLRFKVIAENIAYNKGYEDPGAFAVERWMMSSGHRANILYNGFQVSGIGSYISTDGSVYLTQVFLSR